MTVYLVGAGPGDPELLTVRAARLLSRADVVVHDRLVSSEVLELAAPWAELVNVGKTPGSTSNSQAEINRILVDRGRRFDVVVRLKGGDPYVFGRGAEEAAELADAGIASVVVPGISSAVGGVAAAGIPVTCRNVSSSFTVVTAQQDPSSGRSPDWDTLAKLQSTLVVLMGVRRAEDIARELIAGGRSPDTPVAAVIDATQPTEQVNRGVLRDLSTLAVRSPALLVIGDVAAIESAAFVQTIVNQSEPAFAMATPPTKPNLEPAE